MLIPTCVIKFMELMLTVSCLTLHHYSYDLTDVPTLMLCSGTYIGFVVVLSGEIVGEIVSAAADAYVDAWWSSAGALLYGACGALTLRSWREVPVSPRRNHAQATAVCALAAAALFIVDTLLAICSVHKEDEENGPRPRSHMKSNQCR